MKTGEPKPGQLTFVSPGYMYVHGWTEEQVDEGSPGVAVHDGSTCLVVVNGQNKYKHLVLVLICGRLLYVWPYVLTPGG